MAPGSSPESLRGRWPVWLAALLLAALWHLIFLRWKPSWGPPPLPPRVDIQQIDPRKLEAIRRKWKQEEKKSLLLNKDKNRPSDTEAPKDARYFSDRNIRVEKEQRARETQILPKEGSSAPESPQERPKRRLRLGELGRLGVPLPPAPNTSQHRALPERRNERGGDQALLDRALPEGSENLLNAQESVYYSFYARMYEAIGPLWASRIREIPPRRRLVPGEYTTVVDVVFDREGRLLDVRYLQRSGIPEFEAAVEYAWRKVGRFPNPPRALLDPQGEVHTGWTFVISVGSGGFRFDYLPPERNY